MHDGTMMLTRKQFLRSMIGFGAGAVVLGCSNGGGSPEPTVDAPSSLPSTDAPAQQPMTDASIDAPPTTMACNSTTATIGTNHGHTANVPAADVNAGVQKSYDIKGSSGHPHTITVTAAMFAMLKAGTPVTVTSTNDANHTHTVTITCV